VGATEVAASEGLSRVRGRQFVEAVAFRSAEAARSLGYQLEDVSLPLGARLEAVPHLKQLFSSQTRLLKSNIDANDVDAYRTMWEQFIAWGRHWEPEHDVEELEWQYSVANDNSQRRQLAKALDVARTLAAAKEELMLSRGWGTFSLGAWMLWRYRRALLDETSWHQLVPYVIGPFSSTTTLVAALPRLWDVDGPLGQVEDWALSYESERVHAPYPTASYSDARDVAVQWATVLLLHATSPENPSELLLEGSTSQFISDQLLKNIGTIEQDPSRWESIVGGELHEKAASLRAAIADARNRQEATEAARVAAAALSPRRYSDFRAAQEKSFAHDNRLREMLGRAGSLEVEQTPDAFPGGGFGDLLEKRHFVEQLTDVIVWDWDIGGRSAAREQQETVYKRLTEIAKDVPPDIDPAAAAVAAITALKAEGFEPHVVLVPSRVWVRPVIATHPEFEWAVRDLTDEPRELGTLAGVPVLDIGPADADYILVVDLAEAMTLRERKRPGMATSLLTDVRLIDENRAEELIDAGRVNWDPEAVDRTELVQRLCNYWVEVLISLDYKVEPGRAGPEAAFRVALPPGSHGPDREESPNGAGS
jgi:hypothetical protein